ncbi:plasmid stabilization protein [Clostridium perfringens]|uniref:plasmid stabilization protein n=1 Tax=Clostridium perfringens TaxID=1502 RepID=UPI00155DAE12|nr:plasmid stabilization protein [Clostridium perfringens]ELC8450801.1 plasmid stabilization protein [Clostridium perfringens]MBI6029669.1 plasmid stabilization protein [Clostridium perfringens]MBI6032978.1 plasmid stabilization protein [Clostridium perfringens]MDM0701421.1 plasmid stabilization protein [Clostridium perfringens]MDV5113352.1 plasmid stabilization protein [Clostridium perfringens]
MEKELLELLKNINTKLSNIERGQSELKDEINIINKKLDGVVEQTADLVEFRCELLKKVDGIRDDLSTVELVTANNYKDIAKLKSIK